MGAGEDGFGIPGRGAFLTALELRALEATQPMVPRAVQGMKPQAPALAQPKRTPLV